MPKQLDKILKRILGASCSQYRSGSPEKQEDTIVTLSLMNSINLPAVPIRLLHNRLGFLVPLDYPQVSLSKPLIQWKMEIDDAPIFRYIYRNFQPQRHLEFGTWYGAGTVYCLEECLATVWTINVPFGEDDSTGEPAYGYYDHERADILAWAQKIGMECRNNRYKTDSIGFIGRLYLKKGLGNRVCQIYCDSREWNTANYPPGFFDTVLIDGGHTEDIVENDTYKALPLLKSGGVIMWHDFCPKLEVYTTLPATRGVFNAIRSNWEWLNEQLQDIFWIEPSHILFGIKK